MDYKSVIADSITSDLLTHDEIYANLSVTQDEKNGDMCLPCFKFAAKFHKAPNLIAGDLSASMKETPLIEKTEVVGGYLNFFFSRQLVAENVLSKIISSGYDIPSLPQNGKTVCIDYSSVNVAKQFHIGHLSTTVLGGSLYRIYKFLGYKVVGINHLGDYGTQFGKLIYAFKAWGNRAEVEQGGVKELTRLYVKYHSESETHPEMDDAARKYFNMIEAGDEECNSLFNWFKSITLKEVGKIYDRLNITFDSYAGESFYNDKMQPVIDELNEKGLLKESEGAKIVDLSDYDMPPCLILRSDGASLYATRDLAAAVYRKAHYDFDKCLYVVAYQQNLHFKQFFKVLELMGKPWAKDMVHVAYGMVSLLDENGNQVAMSTRNGTVVLLEDVLNKSCEKCLEIIKQKNPDLPDKEKVASDVGTGAVVFGALSGGRIKDIAFSIDKALSFEGETGPYLQYTHARCCSIIDKAGNVRGKADYSVLVGEEAFALVKLLDTFDSVVHAAAEKYEPSMVSRYLIDLAQAFNKFYSTARIIGEQEDVAYTRLCLVKCVRAVLSKGLELILLAAPEKM